jgi:hypothetical protein
VVLVLVLGRRQGKVEGGVDGEKGEKDSFRWPQKKTGEEDQ